MTGFHLLPKLLICGLPALCGCAVFADFLNPDFLGGIGINTGALNRQGVTLIAFENQTNFLAEFKVIVTDSLDLNANGFQEFTIPLGPDEVDNEAIFCPVGAITLGEGALQENNVTVDQAMAVEIITIDDMGQVTEAQVAYTGQPLVAGRDFLCGDLITVTLVNRAEGPGLVVRVVPSR